MRKDYEKLFTYLKSPEPPAGLFERIILAIKREEELRNSKRLVFGFLTLLIASLVLLPFSWSLLVSQTTESAVLYFVSAALSDIGTFLALWQNFSLAIIESLPITGIIVFVFNIILVIFTFRLFLYKKRLLVGSLLNIKYFW